MKPKAMQDALGGSLQWDSDAVLEKIRAPVVLLSGDPAIGAVMTAEEVARAESIIGECRSVITPEVGHLIHDQAPDVWLDAVNGWLN
jgi:pimeloyl-ACP methyl ester carboxylesterase